MRKIILIASFILLTVSVAFAQAGTTIREKLESKFIQKTVTKENPVREVSVYLPPSYRKSQKKRYPVVFLLHGIGDTDETWTRDGRNWESIQRIMDRGIAEGRFGEMIVVMPNNRTNAAGSFYTNSSVTGNWEDFLVKELVPFIDGKYRTLARRASRGVAGHSMGGYGALKFGMKYPETFSVAFGLNPGVLGWAEELSVTNPAFGITANAKGFDELLAEAQKGNIIPLGVVTVCQAFSPNPDKPPFFCDLPAKVVDGKLERSEPGYSRWEANFPAQMAASYKENLKKLRGYRFDSGYEDEFKHIPPTSRQFSAELTKLGIDHIFEEYNGDHRNRLTGKGARLETEVFPYFWFLLDKK
jgi:enterochelin esterase-like enzyme